MILVSGSEMKEIDRITIEDKGVPGLRLMENAGIKAYEIIKKDIHEDTNVLIVCGAGNNGGDGYVIARKLILQSIPVKVYSTIDVQKLKGDAKENYFRLNELGVDVSRVSKDHLDDFKKDISQADIVVDTILGTGLSRPIADDLQHIFQIVNESSKKIFSIDIPSGIGAENGNDYGSAIKAHKTITFQLPKIGCILYPGAEYTGELIIVDIGIPQDVIEKNYASIYTIDEKNIKNIIKPREKDIHKGSCGKLSIITGSKGMAGAAVIAAKSALRSGVGLVKVIVPEAINDILQISVPEAISIPLKGQSNEHICDDHFEEIIKNTLDCHAVAVGPGLGNHNSIQNLIPQIINIKKPMVMDADALNAISKSRPEQIFKEKYPIIITPHPKELSRLTGLSVNDINKNRIEVTRNFSIKWGIIVVLKGARTVIGLPNGTIYINTSGNPGMAASGSGDALTGIISSFCAQGMSVENAAIAGVYIHGKAGDIMSEQYGEYGLCAGDLAKGASLAIKEILKL